jgi:hypothetical protein
MPDDPIQFFHERGCDLTFSRDTNEELAAIYADNTAGLSRAVRRHEAWLLTLHDPLTCSRSWMRRQPVRPRRATALLDTIGGTLERDAPVLHHRHRRGSCL